MGKIKFSVQVNFFISSILAIIIMDQMIMTFENFLYICIVLEYVRYTIIVAELLEG